MSVEKIPIAIITGEHDFQEEEFDAIFEGMDDIEFVRQDLSKFVKDTKRDEYETIVFYNFNQKNPGPYTERAIMRMGERAQGFVILHHAILAFPEWDEFTEICGIEDRQFEFSIGEKLTIHVAEEHDITEDIQDWEMIDEVYKMKSPGEDSYVLLTTDHPKSMEAIAWIRKYRNAAVFCFQSGHDMETYSVPQFREILYRGIKWVAGRL
jgi:hypothetical protein